MISAQIFLYFKSVLGDRSIIPVQKLCLFLVLNLWSSALLSLHVQLHLLCIFSLMFELNDLHPYFSDLYIMYETTILVKILCICVMFVIFIFFPYWFYRKVTKQTSRKRKGLFYHREILD